MDVYNSLLSAVHLMLINSVKAILCIWEYMIFYPYFPHILSGLDEIWYKSSALMLLSICGLDENWHREGHISCMAMYHETAWHV